MNELWWLIPPVMIAVTSIVLRRNLTLRFGWPLLVQSLFVLAAALVAGLSPNRGMWVAICWVFFILFLLLPNQIVASCERFASTMRPHELLKTASLIKFVYWGALGAFWTDIYRSYAFYIIGNSERGQEILDHWQGQKLPAFFAEQLSASLLVSDALTRNWRKILTEFEDKVHAQTPLNPTLCIQASRAYAEEGQVAAAEECLRNANLAQCRIAFRNFCIIYLAFFSLSGQVVFTRSLIGLLSEASLQVPPMLLRFWWGRCLVAQRRYSEAVALLRKLEAEGQSLPLKGNREAWANRIRYAIQDAEEARLKAAHLAPEVMLEEDNTRKEAAERCWVHFKAGATALQLSTPLRSSRAVNALALSLLLCFLLSGGGDVLANQSFIQLLHLDPQVYKADIKWAEFLFTKLPLNKDVFRTGEYYRLFTYIFLHGSIGHFLLNLTGLLWFGRIAANIYGEGRLLLIYFASGVFAGLVHAYLSDVPAIGASGAILGVFAAVAVGIFKLKKELPQALRIRELRIMGGLAAGQVIMDRIVPRVAGIIHIAGMFAGLVTAALVFPRQEENWLDRLIARHNAKTIELLDH